MSLAYIFPGQGSQKVGMGKTLYDEYKFVREMFHEVDDALEMKLSEIIFNGPEEKLTMTENTQPALLLCSVAVARVLEHITGKKLANTGTFVAGHSLGEFSALTAADSLNLNEAAKLVRLRGIAMQQAVPKNQGTMFALLGAERKTADEICSEVAKYGVCEIANDNSIGQLVLSGNVDAIDKAIKFSTEKGLRAIKLNVSAPFHCSLMHPAQEKLAEALDKVKINKPSLELVANVKADVETEPEQIKQNLITQVTSTVRWTESIQKMIDLGVTHFVELGPGKVLSGLTKRINKDVQATSLQTLDELHNFASEKEL